MTLKGIIITIFVFGVAASASAQLQFAGGASLAATNVKYLSLPVGYAFYIQQSTGDHTALRFSYTCGIDSKADTRRIPGIGFDRATRNPFYFGYVDSKLHTFELALLFRVAHLGRIALAAAPGIDFVLFTSDFESDYSLPGPHNYSHYTVGGSALLDSEVRIGSGDELRLHVGLRTIFVPRIADSERAFLGNIDSAWLIEATVSLASVYM